MLKGYPIKSVMCTVLSNANIIEQASLCDIYHNHLNIEIPYW